MTFQIPRTIRLAGALALALLLAVATRAQQPAPSAQAFALPDWSGAWQMNGPTVFDMATVEPKNGRAGDPGVRERPPYKAEYEAIYLKNIEAIKKGVFPDPISPVMTMKPACASMP